MLNQPCVFVDTNKAPVTPCGELSSFYVEDDGRAGVTLRISCYCTKHAALMSRYVPDGVRIMGYPHLTPADLDDSKTQPCVRRYMK